MFTKFLPYFNDIFFIDLLTVFNTSLSCGKEIVEHQSHLHIICIYFEEVRVRFPSQVTICLHNLKIFVAGLSTMVGTIVHYLVQTFCTFLSYILRYLTHYNTDKHLKAELYLLSNIICFISLSNS